MAGSEDATNAQLLALLEEQQKQIQRQAETQAALSARLEAVLQTQPGALSGSWASLPLIARPFGTFLIRSLCMLSLLIWFYTPGVSMAAGVTPPGSWDCTIGDTSYGCAGADLQPMATPREYPSAVTGRDGLIYVIGGMGWDASSRSSVISHAVETYDPGTNSWASLPPVPSSRLYPTVAAGADGKIYVFGGSNGSTALNTTEAYDPQTKTWSCSAGDPSSGCVNFLLPPMPVAVYNAAASTAVDGRIYAMGGQNSQGLQTTVEAFSPSTGSWDTSIPSMLAGLSFPSAVTAPDRRIYIMGGTSTTADEVQVYDPVARIWNPIAAPPPNMSNGARSVVGWDGRIYVYLTNNIQLFEAYDPASGTWTTIGNGAPDYREFMSMAASSDGGRIYTVGGDGNANKSCDPTSGLCTTVESYSLAPFRSTGNPGVEGLAAGASPLGSAVKAGLYGSGSNGTNLGSTGVQGVSDTGSGVVGTSMSGSGGSFRSSSGAPLHLDPGGAAGHLPDCNGSRPNARVGDVYVDATSRIYVYTTLPSAGCGGSWQALAYSGSGPTDARITDVHAAKQGTGVQFRWRMADGKGVAGFDVYAQAHRLNRSTIPLHRAKSYQYVGQWTGHGPYSLHVILSGGQELTVLAR